ncbi:MAG: EAL domain-containing protein [Clostridia bacterium]
MNKYKMVSSQDKKVRGVVLISVALVCALVSALCFQYYQRLQTTVKAESGEYMQEISRQIATGVDKIIDDRFAVLGTLSSVLENTQAPSYAQLAPLIESQQVLWDFQSILLIDPSGIAHDSAGKAVSLKSDPYLQDVVIEGRKSMSTSQIIDGTECIVFAVPLHGVTVDGLHMLALVGAYELSTFDKNLSMTAFGGKGYAHIVRDDGTVVVRSSSPTALKSGYNILNYLTNAAVVSGRSLEKVKRDIASGRSGQTEFKIDGAHEYMTYTPLAEQKWSLLTFVPVAVVNAKSNILLVITLLFCGFITVTFSLLFAILTFTFYRNKRRLEQIAYVDPVTGGNTIERFYEIAQSLLAASGKAQYALVYMNIEKFKVLNEQFGRDACDDILRSVEDGLGGDLSDKECMGRLFADNYCILAQYQGEAALTARFDKWYKACARSVEKGGSAWLPLIIEFGVYVIDNGAMPFAHMIDRAKLSLSEGVSELRGKLRYAIYDERVRRVLFREKHLEDMMEEALAGHEFQVYLQPKYVTQTEQIGGAEALVRWQSKTDGMIYPDEFVALFEKNGFIRQIDFYVFEQVCKALRKWLDQGLTPVKVSVNCSRVHLKSSYFLSQYCLTADKYHVPHELLEIELTENTVFEDVEHLSEIIKKIHEAGFGCSMDDFGSGYSSLNMIRDIRVDTLKLDRVFFRPGARNVERTESVVGSIIGMAKALSMCTVAEGVEEREQVDILKRLGCDYIQGYFFARPMPIMAFEKLAFPQVYGEAEMCDKGVGVK